MRVGNLHKNRKGSVLKQCGAASALLLAALGAHAEEFQPERLKDGVSLPSDMAMMYVADFSMAHLMDGRVNVIDARTGRYAGVIDAGYAGQFTLSPDGKEAYVSATYMSRHSHGERVDALELYDTSTLRRKGEVLLSKKRSQALFTKELLRTSADGRYAYVQNATPATSVTVVDLQQRKVVTEVSSPGCWGIYPSQTQTLRFSMLCGDGTVNTVTLNEDGSVASRAPSTKFFDSDTNPVYLSAVDDGESYYFLSFHGKLTKIALSADKPVIGDTKELVNGKSAKEGWRPGGFQVMALHRDSGQLFIAMHPNGKEGTHKDPAKEIWVVDLKSGNLLSRKKASHAISLSVNQAGPGYLYAIDGTTNRIHSYDLNKRLKEVYVTDPLGDATVQVNTP